VGDAEILVHGSSGSVILYTHKSVLWPLT